MVRKMTKTIIGGKLVGIEIPPVGMMRITIAPHEWDDNALKNLIVGDNVEMVQEKSL